MRSLVFFFANKMTVKSILHRFSSNKEEQKRALTCRSFERKHRFRLFLIVFSDWSLCMGKKRKLSENEDQSEDQADDVEQINEKTESNDSSTTENVKEKKKPTPGVIYLSRIPTKMNVTIIRSFLDKFAPTGRIYLQLSSKHLLFVESEFQLRCRSLEGDEKGKKERGPKYTEGWVEFKSKRDAKLIAKRLNNQQVGGRRRTPWHEDIWNIK